MSKSIPQILEGAAIAMPAACGPDTEEALANELRTLRAALELTQEEFAARYAIPVDNIRRWEQPRRRQRPDAAARLLIKMIKADPEGMAELVEHVRANEQPSTPTPAPVPVRRRVAAVVQLGVRRK